MIKNVYIQTRPGADSEITDSLLIDVCDLIRFIGMEVIRNRDEITENTLVLALGGDGTMLSAIHIASFKGAYVTGFNYGNLGYLVPDSADSGSRLIEKLRRLLYDLTTTDDISEYKVTKQRLSLLHYKKNFALNDFYVVPAYNGSAADFKVSIGQEHSYFTTKSSGMVVATPMGSTGLALSAGGSILSPASRVFEVVPMLPHTLASRPLIVPDTDSIVISWDRPVNIFADGRLVDATGLVSVEFNCKRRTINLVQPIGWDFYENLKHKMKWYE